jgi:hypothetical protein
MLEQGYHAFEVVKEYHTAPFVIHDGSLASFVKKGVS